MSNPAAASAESESESRRLAHPRGAGSPLAYCFAEVGFAVSVDCPEVIARLEKIFPPSCSGIDSQIECVELSVRQPSPGIDAYDLFVEGRRRLRNLAAGQLCAHLEHVIIRQTVRRAPHHLILHGAAVSNGRRAVLLLGEGGAGKSWLCREMIRAGWDYLSDELAIVDKTTFEVTPFLRSIMIKPETGSAVPQADWPSVDDGRRYLSWNDVRPDSTGRKTPMERLVFCRYRPSGRLRRMELSRSDALHRLGSLVFNADILGPQRTLDSLLTAVRKFPAFELEFSDAKAAANACK